MEHSSKPPDQDEAGGHPSFLAHHFDTPRQQFDAGKLGIWLFLVTEILFFGGLFCAYAVYRVSYPEVFRDAAQYLDVGLGALNTVVLIFSSLTIAWAVRCAQLDQQRGLVALLAITLACACVFLGVKYVEYKQKWEHGLLWSGYFDPESHGEQGEEEEAAKQRAVPADASNAAKERDLQPQPDTETVTDPTLADDQAAEAAREDALRRQRLGMFFAVYFGMTGLHGIHVLAGMAVIGWILVRATKGQFGSDHYGPVDYTALYWHLVDIIWIFLFPLLYLIH